MDSVQYMLTSVLQDQQYMFGVRSLPVDEKVLLMKKDLADVLFQRLIQPSQKSRLSYCLTGVCQYRPKCSNKFGQYSMLKNKTLMFDF